MPMQKKTFRKGFCFVLIFLFSTQAVAQTTQTRSKHELVFGVLPFLSPVVLIKRFSPLRNYLEKITGKQIYLESAPNFPEFVKRTLNHQYDLIFTAPHFVPITLQDNHYQLIAASNKLAAHIMVKGNSDLSNIQQLAGKRVALGPSQAFVVIIARYLLKSKGLIGKHAPLYSTYKSHNATLQALEFDDADAAVIGSYLLDAAEKKGFREIAATAYYPGAVIILSKAIPETLRNAISEAFINIKNSKKGRETLKLIKFPGFQKTRASEYVSLRPVAADALKDAIAINK
jgi:phosphonate transport system substrate-binding protein